MGRPPPYQFQRRKRSPKESIPGRREQLSGARFQFVVRIGFSSVRTFVSTRRRHPVWREHWFQFGAHFQLGGHWPQLGVRFQFDVVIGFIPTCTHSLNKLPNILAEMHFHHQNVSETTFPLLHITVKGFVPLKIDPIYRKKYFVSE